jgi:predicted nucleic acid-binding Zn ribbon protein
MRGGAPVTWDLPFQEIANQLGFVGGEIIEDDMNPLLGRAQRHHFFQQGHKVAAGVARSSFAGHASGLSVQRERVPCR